MEVLQVSAKKGVGTGDGARTGAREDDGAGVGGRTGPPVGAHAATSPQQRTYAVAVDVLHPSPVNALDLKS